MTFFRFSRPTRFACAFGLFAGVTRPANTQASPSPAPPSATEEATPPQVPATARTRPVLEPKAIEIMKATSAAGCGPFHGVHGGGNLCEPELSGLLERRDKLRVITFGDGPVSEVCYDGKTMTAFAPAENPVAFADAPPTVDGMLGTAYHSAAIYLPSTT